MITIALYGHPDIVTLVDDVDSDLAARSWCLHAARRGNTPYAFGGNRRNGERGYLHKIVMERVLGRPLSHGETVDHCNRQSLDNRRGNLRLATRTQQSANSGPRGGGSSQYKGVTWCNVKKLWRAEVWEKHKRVYSKYFSDEDAAALARNVAAREHYGEFAYQNYVVGIEEAAL